MIEVKGLAIDKKWKWVAKDENGQVFIFECKPNMSEQDWHARCAFRLVIYPTELNSIPWDQSLHEIRHTKDGIILTQQQRPDFVIDDPIMVRNSEAGLWVRMHFAGWDDNGRIRAFDQGCTSFSSAENAKTWAYYRLPTPEELNRNANHK